MWVVKMRLVPVLALMTSALSLAACGGGGGGFGGSVLGTGVTQSVGVNCPLTPVNNTPDPSCVTGSTGGTPTPTIKDEDGDGIPDVDTDGDGQPDDQDGSTGSGAGGNTSNIVAGNKAIVLMEFAYDKPTSGTAMTAVLRPLSAGQAGTDASILSNTKPSQLIHYTDTNSTTNSQLATPIAQREYAYGTRDLDWIGLGHHTFDLGTLAPTALGVLMGRDGGGTPVSYYGYPILLDEAGNQNVVFDPVDKKYKYATVNTDPDPDNDVDTPMPDWIYGESIDYAADHFWDQVKGSMDARANGGTTTDYREYRVLSERDNRDELLQVWDFGDSYATQYQNAIKGGVPKHQVWSFGGNKATAMPTGGTATYRGRWVGTAQSTNWLKPKDASIDPNALWRVEGNSSVTANFTDDSIRGTLTPESWTSYQEDIGAYTWFTTASGQKKNGTTAEPDYSIIYETKVLLDGKIDQVAVPGAPGTFVPGNTFSGEANLSGAYITGDNPMYGGFFGTNGNEVTGVFNAAGVYPNPQGGSQGITDSRRGNLTINGAFNGDCVPGVTCAPPPAP